MNGVHEVVVASLRNEIAEFAHQQFLIGISITTLLIVLAIAAQFDRGRRCALLIPVSIGSGLWAIGRTDMLMHRAGAYITTIEGSTPGGWEPFKSQLFATRMLPLYDSMTLGVWLVLFWWAESRAGDELPRATARLYRWLTVAYVASGVAAIVFGART